MPDTDQTVIVNGEEYSQGAYRKAVSIVNSGQAAQGRGQTVPSTSTDMITPGSLRAVMGNQYGDDREVWDVLGYDKDPEFEDLHAKWERGDIAGRIVDLPAKDTWRRAPTVEDAGEETSEFEEVVNEWLEDTFNSVARRADIAAGIGEYGVLVLGFADGAEDFSTVVDESAFEEDPTEDIAYFETFNQGDVEDWILGKDDERDISDPRYNKPVEYSIDFSEEDVDDDDVRDVHWSRVIHIPATEPVFGQLKARPRLISSLNRLDDLEKVVGSAAEAQWHGADRKYHFDVRDGYADLGPDDMAELDEEVQKLVHELQPYVKTAGMDLNVVGGDDVDPSGPVDAILKLISGATGIPKRKLVGSERGEQASTQDRANWFDQVHSRQTNFAEDFILRPTIDRLLEFGILPQPADGSYEVGWPNLFELTEVEESEVAFNRARAAQAVSPQGNTDLLPGGMTGAVEYVQEGEFPEEDDLSEPMDGEPVSEEVQQAFEDFQNAAAEADD